METAHMFSKVIGTTIEKVLGANPKRTNLKIYNAHATNLVYVCSKPTDTADQGYIIRVKSHYENQHNQGEVLLIAGGASTEVRIEEDAES